MFGTLLKSCQSNFNCFRVQI